MAISAIGAFLPRWREPAMSEATPKAVMRANWIDATIKEFTSPLRGERSRPVTSASAHYLQHRRDRFLP